MKPGIDYVGVCTMFVCYDIEGRVLMHQRGPECRDEHGRWCGGAGQLEHGEQWADCVAREVREEYGVEPVAFDFCGVTNVIRESPDGPTHWVALLFAVFIDEPERVAIQEPGKMTALAWFSRHALPSLRHSQFDKHFEIIDRRISAHLQRPGGI